MGNFPNDITYGQAQLTSDYIRENLPVGNQQAEAFARLFGLLGLIPPKREPTRSPQQARY